MTIIRRAEFIDFRLELHQLKRTRTFVVRGYDWCNETRRWVLNRWSAPMPYDRSHATRVLLAEVEAMEKEGLTLKSMWVEGCGARGSS